MRRPQWRQHAAQRDGKDHQLLRRDAKTYNCGGPLDGGESARPAPPRISGSPPMPASRRRDPSGTCAGPSPSASKCRTDSAAPTCARQIRAAAVGISPRARQISRGSRARASRTPLGARVACARRRGSRPPAMAPDVRAGAATLSGPDTRGPASLSRLGMARRTFYRDVATPRAPQRQAGKHGWMRICWVPGVAQFIAVCRSVNTRYL